MVEEQVQGDPQKRAELFATAKAMLDGGIHLVEGCRVICRLCHQMGEHDNSLFLPILAIESDTDQYPLGDVRRKYNGLYLQRLDQELGEYLDSATPVIHEACRRIVAEFATSNDGGASGA